MQRDQAVTKDLFTSPNNFTINVACPKIPSDLNRLRYSIGCL